MQPFLSSALTTILLFLVSCSAPVYEFTTYGIDEFLHDSQQISEGKLSILVMEEHESIFTPELSHIDEDIVVEGDELSIVLYCPKRPDRVRAMEIINARAGFSVCNGTISLPHLDPIPADNISLNELKTCIQNAYAEQIPDIQVYLNFKKRTERSVQIIGANEGTVRVDGKMRLSEVLAMAKIGLDANLFKSYVMRNGRQLPVDLYKLIHEGDECQNIVMKGGDQIYIANQKDSSVIVTGEVGHPIVIPVPYGFISLREALVIAGGIPFTGSKNCIYVIRGDLVRPKIYHLAWKELIHYSNQSLLLMPGDIITVSAKPISDWNRFINQLLPSSGFFYTGWGIYGFF